MYYELKKLFYNIRAMCLHMLRQTFVFGENQRANSTFDFFGINLMSAV